MFDTLNNSFLGFTDTIKQPRKTKVEDTLSKLIRSDGKVYSLTTWIINGLLEGRQPEKEENYSTYKVNGYGKTKPRTLYKFNSADRSYYNKISKTEYDFACYCLNNGLNTEETINTYLAEEKARNEAKRKAEEEEKRLAEEKALVERKEVERVKQMIREELENIPEEEKRIMNSVFESILGSVDYSRLNYSLLALIHHFDNPICKNDIISRLHNDNKASIKTFECITGLKLPKGYKERIAYLESITSADFKGMTEYKPRKKAEAKNVQMETFYINKRTPEGCVWEAVEGEPITKYGIDMFIHYKAGEVSLTHAESGVRVTFGKNKTECFQKLKEHIDKIGMEKFKDIVDGAIKQVEVASGKNPRYIEAEAV